MIPELETPTQFKEWLLSRKPNEVVGKVSHCNNCPIANYLSCVGYEYSYIDSNVFCLEKVNDDTVWYDNSSWLKAFIEKVDKLYTLSGHKVTKEECLKVLDNL